MLGEWPGPCLPCDKACRGTEIRKRGPGSGEASPISRAAGPGVVHQQLRREAGGPCRAFPGGCWGWHLIALRVLIPSACPQSPRAAPAGPEGRVSLCLCTPHLLMTSVHGPCIIYTFLWPRVGRSSGDFEFEFKSELKSNSFSYT